MDISIPSLVAQIFNFGLLFFLFKKFLTKPIVAGLEERRELIRKLSRADEEYKKRVQQAEEESKKIISDARKVKENIIADAGILGEKRKNELIGNANTHAEKIIKEAQEKIEHMKKNLESSYEESIKRTSLTVLKKLIKDTPEIKDAYIKESIAAMKK